MSEEKKFRKLIQNHDVENRDKILNELKAACPQYFDAEKMEKRKSSKRKFMAVFLPVGAVAACLAITLPIVLPKKNEPQSNIRTFSSHEYSIKAYDQNIKEYAQANSKNILYFDWYDNADNCTTDCYSENGTQAVLGLKEYVVNGNTGEAVEIQFTDISIYIDVLNEISDICKNEYVVNSVVLKWVVDDINLNGVFEYGDYRYFVTLERNTDENRLFELVESLINN